MAVVSVKREKELARAKFERQQQRRSRRKKRNFFAKIVSYLIMLALIISYGASLVSQDSQPAVEASQTPSPTAPIVAGCDVASPTRANNISYPAAPTDLTAAQEIVLNTNCGALTIQTDKAAPTTVGILSHLARTNFYDGVNCHRLTTQDIFVIQCGSPTGTPSGGPGFRFADENLPVGDSNGSFIYPRGTVAMANSGPNTNGSQFFIVYQDSPLPANYSIWGKISSGLETIDAIAQAGTITGQPDGPPAQTLVISSATTTP